MRLPIIVPTLSITILRRPEDALADRRRLMERVDGGLWTVSVDTR